MKFSNVHTDHYKGQDNWKLLAHHGGGKAGHIDYSTVRNEPNHVYVNFFNVEHEHKKKGHGVALKLADKLRRLHRGSTIHTGTLTADGGNFMKGYRRLEVKRNRRARLNPSKVDKEARRQRVGKVRAFIKRRGKSLGVAGKRYDDMSSTSKNMWQRMRWHVNKAKEVANRWTESSQ